MALPCSTMKLKLFFLASEGDTLGALRRRNKNRFNAFAGEEITEEDEEEEGE